MNDVSPTEAFEAYAIVPAAGIGSRMRSTIPKQYLTLCGTTVIEVTLSKLLSFSVFKKIVVALDAEDHFFEKLSIASDERILTVVGGDNRSLSVLAGLRAVQNLRSDARENNAWAFVHDAARPCVAPESIQQLLSYVSQAQSGGLLASPVADTLKYVPCDSDLRVEKTHPRENLWQAHTPQAYRVNELTAALRAAIDADVNVTDESSAIEWAGGRTAVVLDRRDNIKITHPEDLALAEFILTQQGWSSGCKAT